MYEYSYVKKSIILYLNDGPLLLPIYLVGNLLMKKLRALPVI